MLMQSTLMRTGALVILIAALALARATLASELELGRPINLEQGKGVVVFSFTAMGGNLSQATLRWRREGSTDQGGEVVARLSGAFVNEELASGGAGRTGRLIALSLDEGTYEFHEAVAMSWRPLKSSTLPMSRKFAVTAGQISYVGNVDLLFRKHLDPDESGLSLTLVLGLDPLSTEVHPAVRDLSEADIPLLLARQPQLNAAQIRKQVTLSAQDEKHLRVQRSMEERAARGERLPRIWLLVGLTKGEASDGQRELVRVPRDTVRAMEQARVLASTGEKDANLLLASFHDPDRSTYEQITVVRQPDAALAFRHYLAAAQRYSPRAAKQVMEAYDRGDLGQPQNARLAAVWRARFEQINALKSEALPVSSARARDAFDRFMNAKYFPKEFYLSPSGEFQWWSAGRTGDLKAMRGPYLKCNEAAMRIGERCYTYAFNDTPRWDPCRPQWDGRPDTQSFPDPELPAASAERAPDFVKHPAAQTAYGEFAQKNFPRAFAYSATTGHFGIASGTCLAATAAMQQCEQRAPGSCELVIQDDRIVTDSAAHRKLAASLRDRLGKGELAGSVHAAASTDNRPRPARKVTTARDAPAPTEPKPASKRLAEVASEPAAEPVDPRLADVHAVPHIGEGGKDLYEKFLATKRRPRAFAINLVGASGWSTGPDAAEKAKIACAKYGSTCFLYALDDHVVWDGSIAIGPNICDPAKVDPKLCDVDAVPVRPEGKERYKAFLLMNVRPRTFVISEGGSWRFFSGPNSTQRALEACRKSSSDCKIYAEDDTVVWIPKSKPE